MTVLIVEDEEHAIRSLIRDLKGFGLEVHTVGSYDEFREAFSKLEPEYLIVDKRLPRKRGGAIDSECGKRIVIEILRGKFKIDLGRLFVFTFDVAQDDLKLLAQKHGFNFVHKMRKDEIGTIIAQMEGLV